jgi:hypothetical protein
MSPLRTLSQNGALSRLTVIVSFCFIINYKFLLVLYVLVLFACFRHFAVGKHTNKTVYNNNNNNNVTRNDDDNNNNKGTKTETSRKLKTGKSASRANTRTKEQL